MEFEVNNGRKIILVQSKLDGPVNVSTWGAPSGDSEGSCEDWYTIAPGDFVMMLNWYRHQKRIGNTDLNF